MSRVQSIERAIAVLNALSGGPIGVTEVAERAELPKSTAARMLATLSHEGAVEQVPGGTNYRRRDCETSAGALVARTGLRAPAQQRAGLAWYAAS